MKFLNLILFVFLFCSCKAQNTFKYFDLEGNSISEKSFQNKMQNGDLVRWGTMKAGEKHIQLAGPRFQTYVISYPSLLSTLKNLTGKDYPANTIFLLEYYYVDDICTSSENNKNRAFIRERKDFLNPIKDKLEEDHENLVFLSFFEEGISLSNHPEKEAEYFYQDQGNYLRNSIFRNPAMCGSYALIKPEGEVLVRNGEHRPDRMAELLKPEYWDQVFPKS